MTQEEKQLLLKDLCARIPYGVIVELRGTYEDGEKYIRDAEFDGPMLSYLYYDETSIKPYLRPMSSMTDEERDEFRTVGGVMSHNIQNDTWAISAFAPEAYDWLNEHHFDYRIDPSTGKTLIESGLAFEAPEGMYN